MSSHKPVLVILTPGFPKNESDSTCLPAQQNFIKAVNKNHPAVKIIIVSFQYPFTKAVYTWNGNLVYAFGGRNKNGVARRFLWNSILKQLEKIQQENEIDGMLSFWCDECALIASRFSKTHAIKHFCWLFGQDAKPGNRYVSKISNNQNAFIAISDFIGETFKKNYSIRPFATIPLGIDYSEFSSKEMERDIDILAAGSLIPLKQFTVFLQVAAQLKNTFPAIKLVLCGDGPEASRLKSLAIQLGIESNTMFTGALPHQQVLEYMQRCKVFLHPSLYEGFGMVCTEALYAGAQVVSFCRPMKAAIKNWHIAADTPEMLRIAEHILKNLPASEKVEFFSSEDAARSVMQLFGWNTAG